MRQLFLATIVFATGLLAVPEPAAAAERHAASKRIIYVAVPARPDRHGRQQHYAGFKKVYRARRRDQRYLGFKRQYRGPRYTGFRRIYFRPRYLTGSY